MTYLTAAVAILAALGLIASAIGWRHSLRHWNPSEPESWFAAAKVLYAIAIGTRIVAWDAVIGPWMRTSPEAARAFLVSIGGANANLASSLIVLLGVYASLKARQLLIPEDERDRWPWFKAWQHPSWRLFRR